MKEFCESSLSNENCFHLKVEDQVLWNLLEQGITNLEELSNFLGVCEETIKRHIHYFRGTFE